MIDFSGRTLLIAGGARGIGAATARQYVARGGNVVVGDVNEELGHSLVDELGDERAVFVPLDVRSMQSCREAVEVASDRFGELRYMVYCPITMNPGPLVDLSEEEWHETLDVGLTGAFRMCQAFGRRMLESGLPGAVVTLASIASVQPYGGAGPYSTVKAGLAMLSFQLALEWAPAGIRVNAVGPGHTLTPLTAYLQDEEIRRGRSEATPAGRVGEPIDIANAILFLLSDEADYITAELLMVDGGVTKSIFNHLPGRRFG